MIVFHGCKSEYVGTIYCPYVHYKLRKGASLPEALLLTQALYDDLTDFSDGFMLQNAMADAQMTSWKSPFISTTPFRSTARSFALDRGTKGFIYTIEGPEDAFYDFNKIRLENQFPQHKTYEWMHEFGIPIELKSPFEVIQIEEVTDIIEISTVRYKKLI